MSASNAMRFMADSTGDYGLALKMYMGSLVEAFRDKTYLFDSPGIMRKNAVGTNQHQFLMLSELPEPESHTPGDELLGQQFEIQDGTITIDDILVSHFDVPLDQIVLSHFSVVNELAPRSALELARSYDQRLTNLVINTARTSSVSKNGLVIHGGGNRVANSGTTLAGRYPDSSTGAQNFRGDAAQLAQLMDEDNVPEEGRVMYIDPYIRRVLGRDSTIFDVRFSPGNPNNLDRRAIGLLEGFTIIPMVGRLPSTVVTQYSQSKYNGNFTAANGGLPAAFALSSATSGQAAVGAVTALGINSKMVEDDRRNTTFIKSQMLMGAGQLHPWCAGVIDVTT